MYVKNRKSQIATLIGVTSIAFVSVVSFANAAQISPNPYYGDIYLTWCPWDPDSACGSAQNYLDPFENYGRITIGEGGILSNYGTINNHGEIGTVDPYNSSYSGNGSLNNFGLIYSIGFFGDRYLNNSGTAIVESGGHMNFEVIDNYGSFSVLGILQSDTFTNTGFFEITGNANFESSPGLKYIQTGGQTINHGEILFSSIEILGGSLSGRGTLVGDVNIGSSATVMPGSSPGTLNIDGDLHSNGNYVFEIAGLNSGQYDVLDIDGNAFFTGGNFKFDFIDGFLPSAGDHWDFLVADSLNGLGSVNFTFAGLGDGLGIDLNNEGGKISLTVITAVPEPETYAMLLTGLGLMGFMTYRRKQKEAA